VYLKHKKVPRAITVPSTPAQLQAAQQQWAASQAYHQARAAAQASQAQGMSGGCALSTSQPPQLPPVSQQRDSQQLQQQQLAVQEQVRTLHAVVCVFLVQLSTFS
jgi:hypothetical protein